MVKSGDENKTKRILVAGVASARRCVCLLFGRCESLSHPTEENAQVKPILNPNGSVMISRQRMADGSIREFLHAPNGSTKVLDIWPVDMIRKPRGLLETRYLVGGVVLLYGVVVAVALSLPVSVVPGWLRRRKQR